MMRKEGNVRVLFEQEIERIPDKKLIARARIFGVCLLKGKPVAPEKIFGKIFV
jgi:acyl-CoA thioester hydrolase